MLSARSMPKLAIVVEEQLDHECGRKAEQDRDHHALGDLASRPAGLSLMTRIFPRVGQAEQHPYDTNAYKDAGKHGPLLSPELASWQ